MKFFTEEAFRNKLIGLLGVLVLFLSQNYVEEVIGSKNAYKDNLLRTFELCVREMETLDVYLTSLKELNSIEEIKPVYIEDSFMSLLEYNRSILISMTGSIKSDYFYDAVFEYEKVNKNLDLIRADKKVSDSELAYINDLYNFNKESLLTVMDDQDKQQLYEAMGLKDARYTLCPFDRYVMQMSIKNRVLFEDRFRKRSRNADYPKDEFFSRDHLDFSEIAFAGSNFVGFGDYSIIGKEYNESGFAPYAVAIHIVYFENDNSLRIRHFVSDSNDDITDVAGKFYEAVSKLYEWYITENQERQLTMGLNTLLEHYKNKTYPGLPTLKKLSVMHHLELVGRYLDGDLK